MFKKLFAGSVLVLAMALTFAHFPESHAGQTYYYDTKGNLISKEAYEKLIEKLNQEQNKPNTSAKPSEAATAAADKKASSPDDQETVPDKDDEEDEPGEVQYQVEVSSETILRALRRDTVNGDNSLVLPGYQYLRLDLGPLDQAGLFFHIYGWGRYDFNHSGSYDDNPDGELMYGYLEYNQPDYSLNLKVGRQHLMTGIINNSIDGIGIQSALTPYFKFSVFGGSPVGLSSKPGRSADTIYGGRVAGHRGADYELGFSYKKKYSDGEKDEELAGFDLYAELPLDINLFGFSSYNLDTGGWGQHLYEVRFDIADFSFRPFYQRYRYEDFFNTKDNSANPFRFLADTGETLSVVGSDVVWHRFNRVDLGAKFNYYDYDLRDDAALYVEANANWYLNGLTQVGGQLGRMNGGTNETRYMLSRAFFYWNMPANLSRLGFMTGDVMFVYYDQNRYGHESSLWLSLGAGWRFWDDAMQIKLSGDWSNDPYFQSDLRGQLKIEYNY